MTDTYQLIQDSKRQTSIILAQIAEYNEMPQHNFENGSLTICANIMHQSAALILALAYYPITLVTSETNEAIIQYLYQFNKFATRILPEHCVKFRFELMTEKWTATTDDHRQQLAAMEDGFRECSVARVYYMDRMVRVRQQFEIVKKDRMEAKMSACLADWYNQQAAKRELQKKKYAARKRALLANKDRPPVTPTHSYGLRSRAKKV
jgi:hypothetical protein